jgi:hypothetical protein
MATWIRKIRPIVFAWSLAVLMALASVATVLADNDKGGWP